MRGNCHARSVGMSLNSAGRQKAEAARTGVSAQVGEWLKPADCKSAPPSEVRRFESSPVHQFEAPCGREAEQGRGWEPAAEILSVLCEGSPQ